jgi:superfamily II DNA or RNA helicase
MKFCYPWRPYQARVLDAVHDHLDDRRLHVVAAPGAGKTTLGLEVFRMLGKPAIVLSPTRIIRDQWLERLVDFTGVDDPKVLPWVSNTLKAPKILTSITYQALHEKFADELSEEDEASAEEGEGVTLDEDDGPDDREVNGFIEIIRAHKIQVLMLDEAHHLRAEWWRALDKVCQQFPELTLVALTATPPYDAQNHEWSRYEQLCGPIDEEISVPELVKAGTLCPHQDFIWACDATVTEKKQIEEYDQRVQTLCQSLIESAPFEELVLSHPWLNEDGYEQEILKNPELAITILAFLKAKSLPRENRLMALLDMEDRHIPELGRRGWQVLVEAHIFARQAHYSESQALFIDQLKKQLRTTELLRRRELSLERSRQVARSLSLSAAKVTACKYIHRLELRHRGDSLRQVVLTDYIRDEALFSDIEAGDINLGAWPIFRGLVLSSPIPEQLALLTGRLSIIHTSKLEPLLACIRSDKVQTEPFGDDGRYHKVTAPLNRLTAAFTELLMQGEIKVLVGTRALLGEGWDAPAINSLVLASSVGSFMLTNQMRGRAIRIDRKVPDKISSIWHLVAINTRAYTGWSDYYELRRRFDTFVGLSEKELTIESGFRRMNASRLKGGLLGRDYAPILGNNRQMVRRYKNLPGIAARWKEALAVDEFARVVPSVSSPGAPPLRGLILTQTLAYLLFQLGLLGAVSLLFVQMAGRDGPAEMLWFLLFGLAAVLVYKLPETQAVLRTLLWHLPVDGALRQIGRAVTEALCEAGFIETPVQKLKVNVSKADDGTFYLSLTGCSFYESSIFSDCVAEVLAPIDQPRYLVLRQGRFLGTSRDDYHAVPARFGAKKSLANVFLKHWQKRLGASELIYTRNDMGRRRLLKARTKAFSSLFEKEVRRQDRWQ